MIAALVFFVLWIFFPTNDYSPKGITLPQKLQASGLKGIPSRNSGIILYRELPSHSEKIASIHVELHTLEPSVEQEKALLAFAELQARNMGANGLIIEEQGYSAEDPKKPDPLSNLVLLATAIKA